MNRYLLLAALSLGTSAPAFAQHEGHGAPQTPAPQAPATQTPVPKPPAPKPPAPRASAPEKVAPQPKPAASADQHDMRDMPAKPAPSSGQPAGDEMADDAVDPPEAGTDAPPDAPTDFLADRFFTPDSMIKARSILRDEHGGALTYQIMSNLLEYQNQNGEDGYRWDGQAWFGGDINRVVVKTEGQGSGDKTDDAEVQVLYSRAWDHITDLQIGIRQDIEPNPSRTYLALGFQTLLPSWFEAEGALFVGQRGQVLGRLNGSYDFHLTQRLVLQPRAEFNLAAQNDPAIGLGSGLSDAEVGLRLRYEIQREFAPYIGVSWDRKFGGTADYARADGERAETTSFVIGLRTWY